MQRSLRIKKVYLDAIREGVKKYEYRSVKPFYDFLKQPLSEIVLHYQNPRDKILCSVNSVKVIPTPKHLTSTGIEFTDRVYRIDLTFKRTIRSK